MRDVSRTTGTGRLGQMMEAYDDFGNLEPVPHNTLLKVNKAKFMEAEQRTDLVQPSFTVEPEAEEPAGPNRSYMNIPSGSLDREELVCFMHACGLAGIDATGVDVVEFHEPQHDLCRLSWPEETKYGRRLKVDRSAFDISEIHALVGHCITGQPNGACRCREVELAKSLAKAVGPISPVRAQEVDTASATNISQDQELTEEVRAIEQRLQHLDASSETERVLLQKAIAKMRAARAELEELTAMREKAMTVDTEPDKQLEQADSKKLHEELDRRTQLLEGAAKFLRSSLNRASTRHEAGALVKSKGHATACDIPQTFPQGKPCVILPGAELPQPPPPAGAFSKEALSAQLRGPRGPEEPKEKKLVNAMAAPLTARLLLRMPPQEATSNIAKFSGLFSQFVGEVVGAPLGSVRVLRVRKQRLALSGNKGKGVEGTTVDFGILAAPISSGDVFRKIQHALQDPSSPLLNNLAGQSYFAGAELQLTTLTSHTETNVPAEPTRPLDLEAFASSHQVRQLAGSSPQPHGLFQTAYPKLSNPPPLAPHAAKWAERLGEEAMRADQLAQSELTVGGRGAMANSFNRDHSSLAHRQHHADVRTPHADIREAGVDVDWKMDLHTLKRQCEANLRAMEETIGKCYENCEKIA